MTRSLLSPTAIRRLSHQRARVFSTSRPGLRISASSVGEVATCRQTTPITPATSLYKNTVPRSISRSPFRQHVASFSSSSVRPATKVIQNPRTGDDGETLMIGISPRAVEVRFYNGFFFDLFRFPASSLQTTTGRVGDSETGTALGFMGTNLHSRLLLVLPAKLGENTNGGSLGLF